SAIASSTRGDKSYCLRDIECLIRNRRIFGRDPSMNVVERDTTANHEQTSHRMKQHSVVPEWSDRQKLALAARILAADGHDSGLAGQLTARGPRPTTYC